MQLDYFSGDYQKQGSGIRGIDRYSSTEYPKQFSGLIRSQTWRLIDQDRNFQQVGSYAYGYDDRYQLQQAGYGSADFGQGSFTLASDQAFSVGNIGYDNNGNLQRLLRRGASGQKLHEFNYQPKRTPQGEELNQLASVNDQVAQRDYATYEYNAIGQVVSEEKGEQSQQLVYNVRGKLVQVLDASSEQRLFSYTYDDKGYRVQKYAHQAQQSTYYLRDAGGNLLSIYTQDHRVAGSMPEAKEVPIYGSNRLGFLRPDPIELNENLACFDDSQQRSAYENKSYILVEGAEMTLSEGFEVSYQDLEILLTPTSPEMGSDGDSNNIHLVLRNT